MGIDYQSILKLNPNLNYSAFDDLHPNFATAVTAAKNYATSSKLGQGAIRSTQFVTEPYKDAKAKVKTTSAYKAAAHFVHKHPEILAAGLAAGVVVDILWARSDFASVASNGSLLHLINGLSTITLGVGKNAYLLKGAIALVANKHGWEMMGLRPSAKPLTILSPSPR